MTLKSSNKKYWTKIVLQIKEKKQVLKKYLKSDKSDKEKVWLMCCWFHNFGAATVKA